MAFLIADVCPWWLIPVYFVLLLFAPQTAGLNMQEGVVGDMKALGVREAYKSKLQVKI